MAAQTTNKPKGPLYNKTFSDWEKERALRKEKQDAAAAATPKPAPKNTVRRPTGREEMIQRNIAKSKERANTSVGSVKGSLDSKTEPRSKQPKGDPVDIRTTRRGTDFGGAGNAEIQGKAVENYARQKKKEREGQSNIVGG
jgi:hypothetical protein